MFAVQRKIFHGKVRQSLFVVFLKGKAHPPLPPSSTTHSYRKELCVDVMGKIHNVIVTLTFMYPAPLPRGDSGYFGRGNISLDPPLGLIT